MTQDSWMYGCGVGDARAISDTDWHFFNDIMFCADRSEQGVIENSTYPGYTGLLAATNPVGNTVRIATGVAMVTGVLYTNDANVDFDVTGPGGGAQTDLIVLRYTVANNEIRLAHKQGVPGGAAAAVQQDAAIWEIPIATVYKAIGTNLTTLTDARNFLNHTRRTKKFFVPAFTGWNFTDGIEAAIDFFYGVLFPDNKQCSAATTFYVPLDFYSDMVVSAVIIPKGTGNAYIDPTVEYGAAGANYVTYTNAPGYAAYAVTANYNEEVAPLTMANAAKNQYAHVIYIRNGAHGSDTVNSSIYFCGWIVEYIADN